MACVRDLAVTAEAIDDLHASSSNVTSLSGTKRVPQVGSSTSAFTT